MVSFDIGSLFTNIPLLETIDLCLEKLEEQHVIPHGHIVNQFKSLLEIAGKESVSLITDKKSFKQIDGIAMGS